MKAPAFEARGVAMADDSPESHNGSLIAENTAFAEHLLSEYLDEPSRVSPSWRRYFAQLLASDGTGNHARPSTAATLRPARVTSTPALPPAPRVGSAARGDGSVQ